MEVKDIIILKFLDQYLEASKTLGTWYLEQLNNGLLHNQLEQYILKQWLPTCGYNSEQISIFENEFEKFEFAYAQSLMEKEEPVSEEKEEILPKEEEKTFSEMVQKTSEIVANPRTEEIASQIDLNSFLINELPNTFHSGIPGILEWFKGVNLLEGLEYLFNKYLPQYIGQLESEKLSSKFDDYCMGIMLNDQIEKELPLEVLEINANEVKDNVEVLLGKVDGDQMVATLQPSITEPNNTNPISQKLDNTVIATEQTSENIPVEYKDDAVSNLNLLRELEKDVSENLNKIMLLKEPYKIGTSFVNDNYKHCPSFHNLLPQIQNAIIKKREQKVNEKWFEKYRPELVEEILFPNQVIKETVTKYIENKHIDGNCMFYGTGGVGKTTTNIVLMNGILENVADRFFLDRKIESVDELKGWLNKKPMGKQKIVIAEEFDRLSDAAMTELKNGLMEKYEYVVFLASTNKIHKIDEALLTRFTLISKFETAQISDITNKCRYILTNERIQFTEEDLAYFVEQNKLKGIRTILNNLQLSCYMGVFEPKRTAFFIGDSGTEYDMIAWVKWYINYLIQLNKEQLWYLSYDLNQDQNIMKVRTAILETLMANYSLNYDYIFMELLKDNIFLPIKNCINTYYQDIELKRIKSMHFESMLNDFITILFTTKDIYIRN